MPMVTVHRLTGNSGRGLLVVRPDEYMGLRCQIAHPSQLDDWLDLVWGGAEHQGRLCG
jgi:hypothetical protein